MSDLYFIVAKNLSEYRECREEKLRDPEFASKYNRQTIVLVTSPVHVRGYRIEHGCLYGNWRENPEMFEILQNMVIAAANPEAAKRIRDIFLQWRKDIETGVNYETSLYVLGKC